MLSSVSSHQRRERNSSQSYPVVISRTRGHLVSPLREPKFLVGARYFFGLMSPPACSHHKTEEKQLDIYIFFMTSRMHPERISYPANENPQSSSALSVHTGYNFPGLFFYFRSLKNPKFRSNSTFSKAAPNYIRFLQRNTRTSNACSPDNIHVRIYIFRTRTPCNP